MKPIRVTVWGENMVDQDDPAVRVAYPQGIHGAIAAGLREELGERIEARTATLDQAQNGLSAEVLSNTDVLTWWSHLGHDLVSDDSAARVYARVLEGMGFVVLHSSHLAKPFVRLMGTSCNLRWREEPEREIVWTVNPSHPIARDLPPAFVIPEQEVYGEFFDIPPPDELVFISSFGGGEVFRSWCCFQRGMGRIFYFSPGHETYPAYYQGEISTSARQRGSLVVRRSAIADRRRHVTPFA
jgi:trehalose utilization protein